MVDKYYHYDQISIMIKNQLSQHFEVELAAAPNPKFQQFKQTKGSDIPLEQSHSKVKKSKKHFDDTGSDFMDDDNEEPGKKNKKDKKDKKKDKKKGKDKKNSKDKAYSNDFENDQENQNE